MMAQAYTQPNKNWYTAECSHIKNCPSLTQKKISEKGRLLYYIADNILQSLGHKDSDKTVMPYKGDRLEQESRHVNNRSIPFTENSKTL